MSKPKNRKLSAPVKSDPTNWKHYRLWKRVCEAIRSLPDHFKSTTVIEGMLATDIFTLNAALDATIEEQVVYSLNGLRSVWDSDKKYQTYAFVRQSQTFPDVVLRRKTNGQEILMGIELKGWYLLAKEGMPNFGFTVTPKCCNPWDLIVVVPWALSNVLAGIPVAYASFLESAQYAAKQRNFYWQHEREAKSGATVTLAKRVGPYPKKSDQISDRAANDAGGNFGRLARYGIMGEYVNDMKQVPLRGVSVSAWLSFFHRHALEPSVSQNEPVVGD
jgi:hypothetical protein